MFDSFPVSNETFPAGGSVAESMWWVGCGVYVGGRLRSLCGGLLDQIEIKTTSA